MKPRTGINTVFSSSGWYIRPVALGPEAMIDHCKTLNDHMSKENPGTKTDLMIPGF